MTHDRGIQDKSSRVSVKIDRKDAIKVQKFNKYCPKAFKDGSIRNKMGKVKMKHRFQIKMNTKPL